MALTTSGLLGFDPSVRTQSGIRGGILINGILVKSCGEISSRAGGLIQFIRVQRESISSKRCQHYARHYFFHSCLVYLLHEAARVIPNALFRELG